MLSCKTHPANAFLRPSILIQETAKHEETASNCWLIVGLVVPLWAHEFVQTSLQSQSRRRCQGPRGTCYTPEGPPLWAGTFEKTETHAEHRVCIMCSSTTNTLLNTHNIMTQRNRNTFVQKKKSTFFIFTKSLWASIFCDTFNAWAE